MRQCRHQRTDFAISLEHLVRTAALELQSAGQHLRVETVHRLRFDRPILNSFIIIGINSLGPVAERLGDLTPGF
jgi:hypothetical protein